VEIEDRFEDSRLEERLWLPCYLPQWSSRAQSRARFQVGGGELRLRIEKGQPEWCPEFDPGVRVSSLQTGVFAGPAGSTIGQHRFAKGLVVREEQQADRLFTPRRGRVEIRARACADPGCMVAFWLIGFEDTPEQSGEICVMEIFGRDVRDGSALVGMGIHPFADASLRDDFSREAVAVNVLEMHTYAAEWSADGVAFCVDGVLIKTSDQSPSYPMQVMLGIYEFGEPRGPHPKEFVIQSFRGSSI
jgi:hypothetical protein